MAVKLDTSKATESVKAHAARERDFKFKVARIAMAVVAVVSIGWSVKNGYDGYMEMTASANEVELLEQKYQTVSADIERQKQEKEQAERDRLANEGAGVTAGEDGTTVIQRPMYSAKTAGEETAVLQTLLSNDKKILSNDEKSRLTTLTGSTTSWWGSAVQKGVPLEWEFLTFYDAEQRNYDCAWACWHQGVNGRYLAAVKFGRYDGETGAFAMDANMYLTTFADMLSNLEDPAVTTIDGAVRDPADGGVTSGMLGELTGEGGTETETGTGESEGEEGTEGTGEGTGTVTDGNGEGVTDPEEGSQIPVMDGTLDEGAVENTVPGDAGSGV